MEFAIVFTLMCILEGPLGWIVLAIAAALWAYWNKQPSESDPIPDKPKNVSNQYNNLDFNSYEWEKTWDGKLENKYNGVVFSPDGYGNWYSDDTDENGNSEEYGYYEVKDW